MVTGCCLLIVFIFHLDYSIAISHPDGFNTFKDFQLNKPFSTDGDEVLNTDTYYSPSLLLVPGFPERMPEFTLGLKRSSSRYKNFMLSPNRENDGANEEKESKDDGSIYHFPRVAVKKEMSKRGPGSLLTWALYSKHPPEWSERGFLSPLLNTDNYRLPYGGGRSSAFVASMGKRDAKAPDSMDAS